MQTTITIDNPVSHDAALAGLVGIIRIVSDDPPGNVRLGQDLEQWLTQNSWSPHVKIESDEAVAGCEVLFIPGEHQSNPPVKLAFHAVPGAERVLHRLTHWLYELM